MRISLHHVTASYGDDRQILHDFSFEDEVSSLAIIGRSGCGKTTLLRVLAGLLVPDEGEVWLGGRQMPRSEKSLPDYRRRLGLVFQQGGLFLHMTARDNIAKPLQLVHGLSREASLDRAEELLRRFDLQEHGHKLPRELSGGQYQRIAIARAIAPRAELLLLDEPTSALDPQYTGEVLQMVRELKQDGTRFIIVTHELAFASLACDKVMLMEDGSIAEYGPSAERFRAPETEAMRRFLADEISWSFLRELDGKGG